MVSKRLGTPRFEPVIFQADRKTAETSSGRDIETNCRAVRNQRGASHAAGLFQQRLFISTKESMSEICSPTWKEQTMSNLFSVAAVSIGCAMSSSRSA
jgi:hypothetical protein